MSRVIFQMALAMSLVVFGAGCAGHTHSTVDADLALNAERVEDPLAHLPAAASSRAAGSSKSDPHLAGKVPAMLSSQDETSETSMYLFDIPFRFDRFTLLTDAQAMVEVNAMRLKEADDPGYAVVLEGRCDEVGTRDYNLVLGERRAQTVKEYLINLGIPSASIQTISYGKDRPMCGEHHEACWAKNRTVHFLVKQ
ncbi:MAG TPA: OmpA family protein [Nitrospiraceae bacterium]|nr:OmpA family protein [Nitrospiraceae bacterium]